jgi:hypothetical protein
MNDTNVIYLCVMFMVNGFILGWIMKGNNL